MEPILAPVLPTLRRVRPFTRALADVCFFVVPLLVAVALARS